MTQYIDEEDGRKRWKFNGENRRLSIKEIARIQTFPDWFEFKSKYTTGGQMRKKEVPRYSQVGNAIPPLFALQAGLVLKEMI